MDREYKSLTGQPRKPRRMFYAWSDLPLPYFTVIRGYTVWRTQARSWCEAYERLRVPENLRRGCHCHDCREPTWTP